MAFKVKASTRKSTPAPAGLHAARCFAIVQLGEQKVTFEGSEKNVEQVNLSFECVNTRHAFDPEKPKEKAPFVVHATVTFSFGERSKLRKWLESMNGRKFDKKVKEIDLESELLDVPCQIQVVHSEDGQWANIANVLPAAKGKTAPLTNKTLVYTLDEEDFDKEGFDNLNSFCQEKIKASAQFARILGSGALADSKPAKKGTAAKSSAPPKKAPAKKK